MRIRSFAHHFAMLCLALWLLLASFGGSPARAQMGMPGTNPADSRMQGHDWGIDNEDLSDVELYEIKSAYKKGLAYLQAGECRKAEMKFNLVLNHVKDNAEVYYLAGTADRCQGKFEKAVEQYKSAIENDPAMHLAYKQLGVSYLALGDGANALEQLASLETLRLECEGACKGDLDTTYAELRSAIEASRAK